VVRVYLASCPGSLNWVAKVCQGGAVALPLSFSSHPLALSWPILPPHPPLPSLSLSTSPPLPLNLSPSPSPFLTSFLPVYSPENFANETLDHHVAVMHELIQRDKNRPSVVMWSLANEPDSSLPEAVPYFK